MPTPPFPRPLIAQCARFSAADRDLLTERRHPHTRLGLAYQIAFVRAAGRLPRQKPFEVTPELLRYVADQLGLQVDLIERYAERQPTVSRHADLAAGHLGYRPFAGDERVRLEAFLEEEAKHVEQTSVLVQRAREHLRQEKILRPAASTIRRNAHRTRRAFRDRKIFGVMALVFAGIMAGFTSAVHFVALTSGRQTDFAVLEWPSTLYAVELLAMGYLLGAVPPLRRLCFRRIWNPGLCPMVSRYSRYTIAAWRHRPHRLRYGASADRHTGLRSRTPPPESWNSDVA